MLHAESPDIERATRPQMNSKASESSSASEPTPRAESDTRRAFETDSRPQSVQCTGQITRCLQGSLLDVWPAPWLSWQSLKPALFEAILLPSRSVVWYSKHPATLLRELLCGATVGVMQVPESIAFSFIAHLLPYVGLYSTFFIGLITACLGGKPGMISGMAGALMVVAAALMAEDGVLASYSYEDRFQHLLLTVILMGCIQVVIAVFGLSRFLRLIPRPVHVGFLNGLAIVVFIAQLDAFKTCDTKPFFNCTSAQKQWMSLSVGSTWMTLAVVAVSMVIVVLFPRVPRLGKVVPSSLVAIIVCTLFEQLINRPFIHLNTRSIGETASVSGPGLSLQLPRRPAAGWNIGTAFEYAVLLAMIGIVESLLAMQALNNVTKTPQGMWQYHKECAAQGVGNLVASFFGTVGGSTMFGQSAVNIMSGARGRLSGIFASICIILFASFAGPAIELMPLATLTGILFVIIIKTFDWATFKTIPRIPLLDSFIIVLVTALAVLSDLAIAVAAGVVVAALGHVWQETKTLRIVHDIDRSTARRKVYELHGRLNFATAWTFEMFFSQSMLSDPRDVVINFGSSSIGDYSGLHAIYKTVKDYRKAGKALRLSNLDAVSTRRVTKAAKLINKGESVLTLHWSHLEEDIGEPLARLGTLRGGEAFGDIDACDVETGVPLQLPQDEELAAAVDEQAEDTLR